MHRENSIRTTRYELHLPYTIVAHMDWGGSEKLRYLFVSQPIAADRCSGYDQSERVFQEFEDVIFGQDRRDGAPLRR